MEQIYFIASKQLKVIYGKDLVSSKLREELDIYPKTDRKIDPDIIVSINTQQPQKILAKNPAFHDFIENGFIVHLNSLTISWQKKEAIYVTLVYKRGKNYKQKLRDRQYCHPYEKIGQIFHENVLIPTLLFFFADVVPIHASAIYRKEEGSILFGGTGGIGKTSLLLSSIFDHGFSFSADDFSLLDAHGHTWPNYAYPKIYGYNTLNNPKLKSRIFSSLSPINRLQWDFKYNLRGPHQVRRRVNPALFFPSIMTESSSLSSFFMLNKKRQFSLSFQELKVEEVINLNWNIILTEYSDLVKHIYLHEINAKYLNEHPITTIDLIKENYFSVLRKALPEVKLILINIPLSQNLISFNEIQSSFI